jgi:diacylglycerol kinase family enzyme
MSDFSSITILYNPKSTGPSEKNAKRLERRLARTRYKDYVTIVPTRYAGHAEELARDIAKREAHPLIISSSGDGGYNEVVNGVLAAKGRSSAVTGLLPSGNANDHYKQMHRPYVIRQILQTKVQQIDVLKLSAHVHGKSWHRFAHSYIGFGLTPDIGQALNEADLNSKNEAVIFMKTLLKAKPFKVIMRGQPQEFSNIILSNVGKMSKIFSLSKTALVDDGKFEVFTTDQNRAKLIREMVKSATVGVPHEERTDSFSFRTIKKLPVQLDGEVFEIDSDCKVTVVVVHRKLQCII